MGSSPLMWKYFQGTLPCCWVCCLLHCFIIVQTQRMWTKKQSSSLYMSTICSVPRYETNAVMICWWAAEKRNSDLRLSKTKYWFYVSFQVPMTLGLTIVSSWSMEQSLAEFSVLTVGGLLYICFVILICRVYGWVEKPVCMHVPAMMNDWNGKGPVTVRNVLGRVQCGNQVN